MENRIKAIVGDCIRLGSMDLSERYNLINPPGNIVDFPLADFVILRVVGSSFLICYLHNGAILQIPQVLTTLFLEVVQHSSGELNFLLSTGQEKVSGGLCKELVAILRLSTALYLGLKDTANLKSVLRLVKDVVDCGLKHTRGWLRDDYGIEIGNLVFQSRDKTDLII